MLATWSMGKPALAAGWPILAAGGSALDAVESAIRFAEADPNVDSVGRGGFPDRDGVVSLDAAVMLSPAKCAGVCAVRIVAHPISLARRAMENTRHTLLAGFGAEQFAMEQGFEKAVLLTAQARQRWKDWSVSQGSKSGLQPNFEECSNPAAADVNNFHDTIGVLALDSTNTMAAGCSTSGLPWKLPGRVGDSPIIGHGLYAVPQVGGCVCTGHGELVTGVCGAFLAVETLRRGGSPLDAVTEVLNRVHHSYTLTESDQVGLIVLDAEGQFCTGSLQDGFKIALRTPQRDEIINADVIV